MLFIFCIVYVRVKVELKLLKSEWKRVGALVCFQLFMFSTVNYRIH